MVGGLFYDNYPAGTGLVSGATFGRIAGRNAAAAMHATDGREARPWPVTAAPRSSLRLAGTHLRRSRRRDLTPRALDAARGPASSIRSA